MSPADVKTLLQRYVEHNSGVINVEWDPNLSEKLFLDPFDRSVEGQKRAAHYFLLVASITESDLIGRAENARALMIHLHRILGNDLFNEADADFYDQPLRSCLYYGDFGPEKEEIPSIIASVNEYVRDAADGDLPRYVTRFDKPVDLVSDIARNVMRMGGTFIEKPWMYVHWCIRPYPDLGIFTNFSTRDLYLPLTSYTRDIADCLGLCSRRDNDMWRDLDSREEVRGRFTEFAWELFPDDPAIIDYPLYLLGRWIRGKELSLGLLERYLQFFDELHRRTGTIPVTYDIVSRQMSSFEERVKEELRKTSIMFYFESHTFNLPGGITYRPDFVLPNRMIKGRTVLLEPHGIWGRPETREIRFGNRTYRIPAYGVRPDENEEKFTVKTSLFRETFGDDYYLILIVPARVKDRVERWYPGSYDEIIDGADIPRLLESLARDRSKRASE